MSKTVVVNEVGLRDGLQNQPKLVATADKLRLLDALLGAGITHVEAVDKDSLSRARFSEKTPYTASAGEGAGAELQRV